MSSESEGLAAGSTHGPLANGPRNSENRVFEFGDFEFTVASGELCSAGQVTRLAPQPATVLGILLERAGQVVTRDDLSAKLWPHGYVEVDLGINHCLRQVRQALNDNASDPRYVETLPRRGYRFIEPVVARTESPLPIGTKPTGPAGVGRFRNATLRVVIGAALATTLVLGLRGRDAPAIAVLPFQMQTEDELPAQLGLTLQEFLTEALTELAGSDARIVGPASNGPGLVPSPFDGSDVNRGEELGAALVVSGTVSASDGRALVFAQVVRVSDGAHLWAGGAQVRVDSLRAFANRLGEKVWEAARSR